MRFGKHLGKGLWAFADKSLPAVYGVGFIFLVVRVLPEKEYGAFAVLQSVFTIVTALAFSLAQQPLTKFAAETRENGAYIVAGFILNVLFFGLVSLAAVMFSGEFAALLDPANSRIIEGMLSFLPVLLAAALIRGLTVSLLQADYQIQKIFWIDAAYFLGTMIMVYGASKMGRFNTATDLVHLNTIGLALSSAVGLVLTLGHLRVKLPFRRDAFIRMWDFGKYNVG
ncbi:MAG TPA: hypothetical protein VMW43_03185, partial [Bacteroidota bacterium]|nr:hypothetical protein [Bacteroidota bacterium]